MQQLTNPPSCAPVTTAIATSTVPVYASCSSLWQLYGWGRSPVTISSLPADASGNRVPTGPGIVSCIGTSGPGTSTYYAPRYVPALGTNDDKLNKAGPGLACFTTQGTWCLPGTGGCPCEYISPTNVSFTAPGGGASGSWPDACLVCPPIPWSLSSTVPVQAGGGIAYPYYMNNMVELGQWPGIFSNPVPSTASNDQSVVLGMYSTGFPTTPNPSPYINKYLQVTVYCEVSRRQATALRVRAPVHLRLR